MAIVVLAHATPLCRPLSALTQLSQSQESVDLQYYRMGERTLRDNLGFTFQVDQELKAFTASGVRIEAEAVQLLAVPVVLAAENAPEEVL